MQQKYKGQLKVTVNTKLLPFCAGTRIDSKTFAFEKKLNQLMKCCDRVT